MKLVHPFLQLPLSFDADELAREVHALGEAPWRPHPQGYAGNTALTLVTTGGDPASDALGGAMRPTPHLDRCPYLQQVLGSLGATLGRTRLMRLSGQAEVSLHVDIAYYWREHMRVHVPIVTQPSVRFYCGDDAMHMGAGECWIFDTWRMHRVVNDAERPRIHLVVDTVGGEGFWRLHDAGRAWSDQRPGWAATPVPPRPGQVAALDFETVNVPVVMTPWEMRTHLDFLLAEARPSDALPGVSRALEGFVRRWHGLWACHGTDRAGWPRYRALVAEMAAYVAAMPAVTLRNTVVLSTAIRAIVLKNALSERAPGAPAARPMPALAGTAPLPGVRGAWQPGSPR